MDHSRGFLGLVNDAKSRIREMTIEEYRKQLAEGGRFLLIDVREDREWDAGHLPGAVHLGKGVIERDIELRIPDKSAPIVCYCGGGFRSALVCDNLQKMGYTNAISLDGGFKGWVSSGGDLEGSQLNQL